MQSASVAQLATPASKFDVVTAQAPLARLGAVDTAVPHEFSSPCQPPGLPPAVPRSPAVAPLAVPGAPAVEADPLLPAAATLAARPS